MKDTKNNQKSGFGGALGDSQGGFGREIHSRDFRNENGGFENAQNYENAEFSGDESGFYESGANAKSHEKGANGEFSNAKSHANGEFSGTQSQKNGANAQNAQARHNAKQAYAEQVGQSYAQNGDFSEQSQNAQHANADFSEASEQKDELIACQIELAEMKDKYVRANAEFDNIKKRLEKEKASALAYANEGFARDLLDVLDALEAAANVEAQDDASAKIKEGVENTLSLLLSRLAKHGIKPIEQHKDFDPNLHEAMMNVQSPHHASSAIVDVYQKGYLMGERVLRPSKVSVAK